MRVFAPLGALVSQKILWQIDFLATIMQFVSWEDSYALLAPTDTRYKPSFMNEE